MNDRLNSASNAGYRHRRLSLARGFPECLPEVGIGSLLVCTTWRAGHARCTGLRLRSALQVWPHPAHEPRRVWAAAGQPLARLSARALWIRSERRAGRAGRWKFAILGLGLGDQSQCAVLDDGDLDDFLPPPTSPLSILNLPLPQGLTTVSIQHHHNHVPMIFSASLPYDRPISTRPNGHLTTSAILNAGSGRKMTMGWRMVLAVKCADSLQQ